MSRMNGFVTMYLVTPMSQKTLPVHGDCWVDGCRVTLTFPFTGIEFDLPRISKDYQKDYDFKIKGAHGDITLTMTYNADLKCFTGSGIQDEDGSQVLKFYYCSNESPMSKFPRLDVAHPTVCNASTLAKETVDQ